MYHHKRIRRFSVNGIIHSDAALYRFKEEYIKILTEQMRDVGYVVRIDVDPDFTIMYNGDSYGFLLSLYGVYVGKKKAECIKYLDGHRPHMMEIKSPQSLVPQE